MPPSCIYVQTTQQYSFITTDQKDTDPVQANIPKLKKHHNNKAKRSRRAIDGFVNSILDWSQTYCPLIVLPPLLFRLCWVRLPEFVQVLPINLHRFPVLRRCWQLVFKSAALCIWIEMVLPLMSFLS